MIASTQATGDKSGSKRSLVVVVREDPRTSARAAEAVRLAEGIAGWGEASVELVMEGGAACWWRARQGWEPWGGTGEPGSDLEAAGVQVIAEPGEDPEVGWGVVRARAIAKADVLYWE